LSALPRAFRRSATAGGNALRRDSCSIRPSRAIPLLTPLPGPRSTPVASPLSLGHVRLLSPHPSPWATFDSCRLTPLPGPRSTPVASPLSLGHVRLLSPRRVQAYDEYWRPMEQARGEGDPHELEQYLVTFLRCELSPTECARLKLDPTNASQLASMPLLEGFGALVRQRGGTSGAVSLQGRGAPAAMATPEAQLLAWNVFQSQRPDPDVRLSNSFAEMGTDAANAQVVDSKAASCAVLDLLRALRARAATPSSQPSSQANQQSPISGLDHTVTM